MNTKSIYVSYCDADQAIVDSWIVKLRQFENLQIYTHKNIQAEIEASGVKELEEGLSLDEAISRVDIFICCLSSRYDRGDELSRARQAGMNIIGVKMDTSAAFERYTSGMLVIEADQNPIEILNEHFAYESKITDARLNEQSGRKPKVFISYNRAHQDIVRKIAQNLESVAVVWIDTKFLYLGDELYAKMQDGIYECDLFICFLSKKYCESKNCLFEIKYATDKNKRKIAVRLDESELIQGCGLIVAGMLHLLAHKFENNVEICTQELVKRIKNLNLQHPINQPRRVNMQPTDNDRVPIDAQEINDANDNNREAAVVEETRDVPGENNRAPIDAQEINAADTDENNREAADAQEINADENNRETAVVEETRDVPDENNNNVNNPLLDFVAKKLRSSKGTKTQTMFTTLLEVHPIPIENYLVLAKTDNYRYQILVLTNKLIQFSSLPYHYSRIFITIDHNRRIMYQVSTDRVTVYTKENTSEIKLQLRLRAFDLRFSLCAKKTERNVLYVMDLLKSDEPRGICYFDNYLYICMNKKIKKINPRFEDLDNSLRKQNLETVTITKVPYVATYPIDYEPFEMKINDNIACVISNLPEQCIFFHNINQNFSLIKRLDLAAKTIYQDTPISLIDNHFLIYFHKEKKYHCYNSSGEQVLTIAPSSICVEMLNDHKNSGFLFLNGRELFISTSNGFLIHQ